MGYELRKESEMEEQTAPRRDNERTWEDKGIKKLINWWDGVGLAAPLFIIERLNE